jgi:acetate kinase
MEMDRRMKILVFNSGSSSIKTCLYDLHRKEEHLVLPLWEAHLDWKESLKKANLVIKNDRKKEYQTICHEASLSGLVDQLLQHLVTGETAVLSSLKEIQVVGHRIVHGGREFKESSWIRPEVKDKIRKLSEWSPLHNITELEIVELVEDLLEGIPQLAVFDTAFHQTMPKEAAIYPGPYQWYEEGIQRYGFHGISFQYCSKRALKIVPENKNGSKMVICHLGSGASLCAVKEGKSIDTTMGFTPLDGLMMNTRCGSLDPGILLYLFKKGKDTDTISNELYHQSGLFGLSGQFSDMRDILDTYGNNPRSKLALDVYVHRLRAMIASMVASLQGIDILVFTGGIGENVPLLRQKTCEAFAFLGIKMDLSKNEQASEDSDLSAQGSTATILLIHTQEAFEIAKECWKAVQKPL